MQAILVRLTPEMIAGTWPRIEALVAAVCKRSGGRYTAPDIRMLAERGELHLWIALDEKGICAVSGTTFVHYPQVKAFHIHFGTGRNRKSWQHFMDDMCAWGKSQGATIAESNFRFGWLRILPGWRHTHASVERAL